jgi:hypothetical protein
MIVSRSWFIVVSDPLGGILLVGEGHKVEDQRMFRHQCKTPSELVVSIALTCCCRKCRSRCWSFLDPKHLAMNYEDEFVHVCRKMGYPIFSVKMDAATACAMWQEANVSRKSQRTILRYLTAEYGCRLVVPEAEVDAFGQDHVPPVTGSFEDPVMRKTIHFWLKPIAKLLEVSVSTYVREKSIAADDSALGMLKSIDVVLGGDHGQGKFRSVIKIILGDDDGKQVDSMVMKVGHIDCVKDTYDILKSSVVGPLNESIEEVVKSGALQLIREQDGKL